MFPYNQLLPHIPKTRIAVVDNEKCKPKKCNLECKKFCPVERTGKECVTVTGGSVAAAISEVTCIGCNICVKQCPFGAITIINLPHPIDGEITHRYSPNSFMLHRLPRPRRGQVLGVVGSNGTGKTTALKILSGKMIPNFNDFEKKLSWDEVATHFRGSELQNYFRLMTSGQVKVSIKPQQLQMPGRMAKGNFTVGDALSQINTKGNMAQIVMDLDLTYLLTRELDCLGGGEEQRFCIAYACCYQADIYLFDEPSNYLDIKQRVKAARAIRSVLTDSNYVIVVEHDLSLLEYLSDFMCILYGVPGGYGVVTMPYGVREGINIFLNGFLPKENTRFRAESVDFKIAAVDDAPQVAKSYSHHYPAMQKDFGNGMFKLSVEPGDYNPSEIIVLLGENGTGKTTFVRMLKDYFNGTAEQGQGQGAPKGGITVSYKPQQLNPTFEGTVRQLFQKNCPVALCDPLYVSDVLHPLNMERLMDLKLLQLSGGELQKVGISLALGKEADIYLLDEPSSFLDAEQRIIAAKVIRRFIMHKKKTAFVVDHDFIMATYLADRVIVYEGVVGVSCVATSPQSLLTGMNAFLKSIAVTIRRDPVNYRPRINKFNCVRDREQKRAGTYFYVGDEDEADY